MPIGYWIPIALYSWGVVCALTGWPRLGSFSAIPALLASELPFIVGYLLIAGETGIAGLICRYGYYGDLAPGGDMPPMLVVHGEKDMWIPVSDVRAFVERVRAVSSRPVIYAELPGAHHDFDLFESIRSAAVSQAVEQFTARVSASPDVNLQDRQPAQDS